MPVFKDAVHAVVGHFRGDLDGQNITARGRMFAHRGMRAGVAGPTLFCGVGPPPANLGVSGDLYARGDTPGVANQRVYINNAGVWTGLL